MFVVSFIIGLIIVISSIFMLRSELNKATHKRAQLVEQSGVYHSEDLFKLLEDLQLSFNDMNNAFYDIIHEIEGNVSLNGKEIQDMALDVQALKKKLDMKDSDRYRIKQELSDNLKRMNELKNVSHENASHDGEKKSMNTFDMKVEEDLKIYEPTSKREDHSNDKSIEQVMILRSQGYSLTEIAKKLGMGMGEIQLLINMNHKK